MLARLRGEECGRTYCSAMCMLQRHVGDKTGFMYEKEKSIIRKFALMVQCLALSSVVVRSNQSSGRAPMSNRS
jgi:hypothetical protein